MIPCQHVIYSTHSVIPPHYVHILYLGLKLDKRFRKWKTDFQGVLIENLYLSGILSDRVSRSGCNRLTRVFECMSLQARILPFLFTPPPSSPHQKHAGVLLCFITQARVVLGSAPLQLPNVLRYIVTPPQQAGILPCTVVLALTPD